MDISSNFSGDSTWTCTTFSQYSNNCTKILSVYQIFLISWKILTKKTFWDLTTFTDLDEKLKKVKLRRASTSDLDQQSICLEAEKGQSLKIKKRIKEFQKKHLLAAHEALWGVLGEMKAKGEVHNFLLSVFI